jgi:hypothetical protein
LTNRTYFGNDSRSGPPDPAVELERRALAIAG